MSDHHGGFYILRDDPALVDLVLELALDYLDDTAQDAPLNLAWFGRNGVGALLVMFTTEGGGPDTLSRDWVANNLGFGGRIARACRAPTWGYVYDNVIGIDAVAGFNADGVLSHERTVEWGTDDPRAIDDIADELMVSRLLIEYDLPFATPAYVQPLSEAFDADAFNAWLEARPPMVPPRDTDNVVLHMQTDAARELEHVAARFALRPGFVVDAVWEACKPEIFAAIELVNDPGEGIDPHLDAPPSRRTPFVLADKALPPPPLDPGSPKRALRLGLSADTIREMQELALAGDRSQSYVLQQTYTIGRARLLATLERAIQLD